MSSVDAVVFDLGNVLVMFDWDRAADRLCQRVGRTRRELDDYIVTTPFVNQLGLGEISAQRFFEIVARDFNFTGDFDEFALIWSDIFTLNDELLRSAMAMKGRWPRYILSNTNPMHMDFIFRQFPLFRDFDGHILSHEVGLLKPDARIYEVTLARFGLTAARTVFVDDLLVNVDAARAVGLQAIHHQTNAATRRELTNLGVTDI